MQEPATTRLANEGYRAIAELERLLFFTDLNDDASRLEAAQEGLDAINNLEELLEVSKVDMKEKGSVNIMATTNFESPFDSIQITSTTSTSTSTSTSAPTSTTLVDSSTMNMMDLLKTHFGAIILAGERAVREGERVVFFTDLDKSKLSTELSTIGMSSSGDIWKEVEVVLHDMYLKLSNFKEEVGQKSHKAYKECERTLLFTDLDEVALAKDRSKDDLILHFLNTQDVGKEIEQKFQRNFQVGNL